jgi:hypothetical protein
MGSKLKLSNVLSHTLMAKNKQQKLIILIQIITHTENWGTVRHEVPQCSVHGPLPFLLHVNDLSPTNNSQSKNILFTTNTRINIYHTNSDYFQNSIIVVFPSLNK